MAETNTPTLEQYQQAVNELSARLQITESQRNDTMSANATLSAKVSMLENVVKNLTGAINEHNAKSTSKSDVSDSETGDGELIPKNLGTKKSKTLG